MYHIKSCYHLFLVFNYPNRSFFINLLITLTEVFSLICFNTKTLLFSGHTYWSSFLFKMNIDANNQVSYYNKENYRKRKN